MKKERDYTNNVLVQADEVLRYVAHAGELVTLTDVVGGTGLKRDAVFRILWNLDRLGWAQKVGDGYRLGMGLGLYWARKRSSMEAERDRLDKDIEKLEEAPNGR